MLWKEDVFEGAKVFLYFDQKIIVTNWLAEVAGSNLIIIHQLELHFLNSHNKNHQNVIYSDSINSDV